MSKIWYTGLAGVAAAAPPSEDPPPTLGSGGRVLRFVLPALAVGYASWCLILVANELLLAAPICVICA